MSVAQDVLTVLEATGEVLSIVCPGCKAVVDLAEAVAVLALKDQTTEAQQVASAEAAVLATDAAAHK